MTENQEKELFTILGTIVTEVRSIGSDVQVLKSDVQVLKSDVQVLKSDVQVLKSDVQELKTDVQDIKRVQNEHSIILRNLEAKTNTIAETVIDHEKRLNKLESEVEDLKSNIH